MKGLGETDILLSIFGEIGRVHSVGLEQVSQDMYVLKTAVQTLAVEGHHGMCRVPEDHGRAGEVVRLAFYADERKVWVSFEGCDQVRRRDQ